MKNKKEDRVNISASLSRKLHDRLLIFMKQSGLGKSSVIKMALHEFLKKELDEDTIKDSDNLNKEKCE